jgi:phage/plasmid-like protein (TIGR03299 family)
MSKETLATLNTQTLIGYTDKRGTAWHYRAEEQGDESNHYPGAIPVEDVHRRLFNFRLLEGEITASAITDDGVISYTDPNRKAIMRSDNGHVLGVFKLGYQPHEYGEWLVQNVANLLDADLAVGSAGLLRDGAQAWVQIELAETRNVAGIEYRPWLTAATSADGSIATDYIRGNQLVVCDNTLSAALGSAAVHVKTKHTRRSLGRLADARDALGIITEVGDEFDAAVEALLAERVTPRRWSKFVAAFSNPDGLEKPTGQMVTKATALNLLWKDDERVTPWKGTAYGVLAAVNTWTHHIQTVRGRTRAEANMARVVAGKHDELDRSTLALLATV